MVRIISQLYESPLTEISNVKNSLDTLRQEKTVEQLLRKFENRDSKVEWQQSSATDGKKVYTTITAIIQFE